MIHVFVMLVRMMHISMMIHVSIVRVSMMHGDSGEYEISNESSIFSNSCESGCFD